MASTSSRHHITLAASAAALVLGLSAGLTPAAAIDAALAKQCNAMLAKAFPPRDIGNPAAGRANGDSRQQRAYFKSCVENNGKMDEGAAADKK